MIDFLLNHFQSLSDYDNSLRLYRRAFLDNPGLTAYQALKTFVQEANPGWYEQWDDFADAISSDYPGEIIEYYRAKVEWTIGGK